MSIKTKKDFKRRLIDRKQHMLLKYSHNETILIIPKHMFLQGLFKNCYSVFCTIDLELHQIDVQIVFPYGELWEPYMSQLDCFEQ